MTNPTWAGKAGLGPHTTPDSPSPSLESKALVCLYPTSLQQPCATPSLEVSGEPAKSQCLRSSLGVKPYCFPGVRGISAGS